MTVLNTWDSVDDVTIEGKVGPATSELQNLPISKPALRQSAVMPQGKLSKYMSTTERFAEYRADETNQRLEVVSSYQAQHGGAHRHICDGCGTCYEHDHGKKDFAAARCYLNYCEKCLGKYCYAKAMQGWLHSTPMKVMHQADLLSHARANQVTLVVCSETHALMFGDFKHHLMVRVNSTFDHVEGVEEVSPGIKTKYKIWQGTVALATHTLKEILTGLAKMPPAQVQSFYDDADRKATSERYGKAAVQPAKKPAQKRTKTKPMNQAKSFPTSKPPVSGVNYPVPKEEKKMGVFWNAPPTRKGVFQSASYKFSPYDQPSRFLAGDLMEGVGQTEVVVLNEPNTEFQTTAEMANDFLETRDSNILFLAGDYREPTETQGTVPDEPNTEFRAARWAATDMAPFDKQIDAARGIELYGAKDVAVSLANFLEADGRLPRRFENTIAKKVKADALVTLGFQNYSEDDTIIVITPNLQANRGAIILSKSPGDVQLSASKLVGIVIPQIDTEDLGALQNVNGSKLCVSFQQSTGADSSVTAYSNSVEGCVTTVSPWSTIAGKAAYATASHESLQQMLTDETMVIANLNYGVPDHLVRTGGTFDQQSSNVDVAANYIKPAPDSVLETGDNFSIIAYADGPSTNGILPLPEDVAIGQTYDVWRLSQHASYLRHILYGAFTFDSTLFTINYAGSAPSVARFNLLISFIDGTQTELVSRVSMPAIDFFDGEPATSFTPNVKFMFRGSGTPELNAGKIITDMVLSYTRFPGDQVGSICLLDKLGSLKLTFDAINAATNYSMVAITGARRGQTMRVSLQAETEILLDPTGEVARYLSPEKGPAVNARDVAYFINSMYQDGAHLYLIMSKSGKLNLHAGDFGQKIKHFLKRIFQSLGPIAGTAGQLIGGAVGGAPGAAIGQAVGDSVARMAKAGDFSTVDESERICQLLETGYADMEPAHASELLSDLCWYKAATFSAIQASRSTGFSFPVVADTGDVARIVDVVKGSGTTRAPSEIDKLRQNLFGNDVYTGASCGLAFLLAAASLRGAPTIPGTYTGEVRDVVMTKSATTFTLLPVGFTDEKLGTFDDHIKLAACPDGLYEHGKLVTPGEITCFDGLRQVHVRKVRAPLGYPDSAYQVALLW